MGPINDKVDRSKKKTWVEINKIKKEERKKWKELNFQKKLEKSKLKSCENVEISSTASDAKVAVSSTIISTISIAVPGSILENAQSPELRTYLAGQIARAACIFQVDEIIVFDDYGGEANSKTSTMEYERGQVTARHSCIQFGRILQYLECPQYLRKFFFPLHKDLKYCGILNPLNAPHHLTVKEEFSFREGIVLNKPTKSGSGALVNVGLLKDVQVDKCLTAGLRCTVKLSTEQETNKKLKGIIVPPSTPRKETGIYWGYDVRIATSMSKVFSQSPYKDGYDLTIGTSDKGTSVDEFECRPYKHLLVMFGGLNGLEAALENDQILNADDPQLLFDHYLNTVPTQGSKTIRTEEAILVSLSALRPKLKPICKPKALSTITSLENCESGSSDNLSRFD